MAMNVIKYKTERQWLEARFDIVTGTGIAKIMGLSKWGDALSEYNSKKARVVEKLKMSDPILLGKHLEGGILRAFNAKTGLKAKQAVNSIIYHDTIDRIGASHDGFIYENKVPVAGIEIKYAPTLYKWMKEGGGSETPVEYQAQCQWNMLCSGLDRWYVAAALGRDLFIEELVADEDVHEYMLEQAMDFWKAFDSNEPPEPTGVGKVDIEVDGARALYEAGVYTEGLVKDWVVADELYKAASQARDKARQRLQLKCEPAPGVQLGRSKITWAKRWNASITDDLRRIVMKQYKETHQ
jgi:predicted phage-related endonuclease